jgi:hypothetical protein
MKTVTNIKVENPCPFLLNRMKKEGNNYFCNSCSKTVIDFRDKTEDEIKCNVRKDTCGIFTIDQLKGHKRQSFLRQTLFYCLTVLSFLGFNVKPLTAQTIDTNKTQTDTVIIDSKNERNDNEKVNSKNISKDDVKKKEKRNLFRRKKRPVIGCPSF